MKLSPTILLMFSASALAGGNLVVMSTVRELPRANFSVFKRPDCDQVNEYGNVTLCLADWVRYQLTEVVDFHGKHLANTVALIEGIDRVSGPVCLSLRPLSAKEAIVYGAQFMSTSIECPHYKNR
jgi:hypothetical protein